jgi:hypothetical protein
MKRPNSLFKRAFLRNDFAVLALDISGEEVANPVKCRPFLLLAQEHLRGGLFTDAMNVRDGLRAPKFAPAS